MVEFQRVSLTLGDKQILKDLSFKVGKGEIVLLTGNSGQGKSTILKLILGLLKPTSGNVVIFGKDITRMRNKELMKIRQKCGIVFQSGALFDSLTVEENVSFFLVEALNVRPEEAKMRSRRILDYLGLDGFTDYYPSQLSGGMKKRVAIARAIVTDPKLLLYDEPTAGLDAHSAFKVVELIRDLQERLNVTSIIVSHELHYFIRLIDKILHLEDGHITWEKENSAELIALNEKMFLEYFSRD